MLIQDMVQAVREGREPYVTAESARITLATALAMYESADSGKPVSVAS
jgi:UDP-N-acetyl-2-amino-2-deoxyglucuronate dehydrogenase